MTATIFVSCGKNILIPTAIKLLYIFKVFEYCFYIYRGKANFPLSLVFTIVRFNTIFLHCVRINVYAIRVSEISPQHIKLKSQQEKIKPSTSCFCHLLKWLHEEEKSPWVFSKWIDLKRWCCKWPAKRFKSGKQLTHLFSKF